jgi:hypothetical protein
MLNHRILASSFTPCQFVLAPPQIYIKVFWDTTLRHGVIGHRRFEATYCLHLQASISAAETSKPAHRCRFTFLVEMTGFRKTHFQDIYQVVTFLWNFRPTFSMSFLSSSCLLHNRPLITDHNRKQDFFMCLHRFTSILLLHFKVFP